MIRKCTLYDLTDLVTLAFERTNIPEHNSAYCCNNLDSIEEDLKFILESELNISLGYFDNNTLIGMLSLFVDEEKFSADCIGPFVGEGYDYINISKQLFNTAREQLGKNYKYNFFFNIKNTDCVNLMNTIGGINEGNESILYLTKSKYTKHDLNSFIPFLPPSYEAEFIKLHDIICPNIYASGKDIMKDINKGRQVFGLIEENQLTGYSVLQTHPNSTTATAEIIAVKENFRHQGRGRNLLHTLIQKAFEDPTIEEINLVVDNINVNAYNLYTSVGYELKVENCSYCVNSVE